MMTKIRVSVVVPIYNVEKYLHQCVNSILAQTLKDIEIILVDDGSPDNCPAICDEFAKQDNRVKVIHKTNGGLGAAYNTGIDAAQGEYIGFVESDDWIEPKMYQVMYDIAVKKDADLIKCDFYSYNSQNTPASVPHPHGNANLQAIYPENKVFSIDQAPLLLAYHSSVWASLYKKEFIKNLRFKEDRGAAYVDLPFMFEALLKAKNIVLTYNRFNHYRMEEGQNSSTLKPGRGGLHIIEQILFVKDRLKKYGLLDKYAEPFYYHASRCCCGFLSTLPKELKPEFYKQSRRIYKDFPKNFSFCYFEDTLKYFTQYIIHNDEKVVFFQKKPRPIFRKIIKILSCFIWNREKRHTFRNKYYKGDWYE